MERRQFIHVTAAGIAGLGLSGGLCLPAAASSLRTLARPELLQFIGSQRVVEVGRAYRAAVRDESTVDDLTSAIMSGSRLSSKLTATSIRSRLAKQISDDFARQRTIELNGWILSLTEARQCALYSIVSA